VMPVSGLQMGWLLGSVIGFEPFLFAPFIRSDAVFGAIPHTGMPHEAEHVISQLHHNT
jgi:hypothetical protein